MDWALGRYETTAEQLLGAAAVAVDEAAPQPGERVLDIGCGTGNATLLAAERGADVTGIDPAQRLLDVAAERGATRGVRAGFARADAAALPARDGTVNAVLSVFGVIFAPSPEGAAREIARVLRPGGRAVITAWYPSGAISETARMRSEALAAATGTPAPPMFAWHDAEAVAELFPRHGVDARPEQIAFSATSVEAFMEGELADHPMWISARAALEPGGDFDDLCDRAREVYAKANEDRTGAFTVTSRYAVVTVRA